MNISKETAIQAGIYAGVFLAGVITTKVVSGIARSIRAHKANKATVTVTVEAEPTAEATVTQ